MFSILENVQIYKFSVVWRQHSFSILADNDSLVVLYRLISRINVDLSTDCPHTQRSIGLKRETTVDR